jgi:hypothetical protein
MISKNKEFIIILNKLPECIVNMIYDYIPRKYLVFTNKNNYKKYHYILKSSITYYDNYIKKMVRKDCNFIFETIINENYNIWKNIKQYQYKNNTYKNYIYFIIDYCIENESTKCKELITKIFSKENVNINQPKKNIYKYTNGKIKHK